jgi:hypothetical protein
MHSAAFLSLQLTVLAMMGLVLSLKQGTLLSLLSSYSILPSILLGASHN